MTELKTSRECYNTYVINGTLAIRSYHAYLNYYFEVLRPAGLTTVCVGSSRRRGRECFQLQTVERGKEHEFISQQRIR